MKSIAYAILVFAALDGIANADDPTPFSKIGVDACRLDGSLPSAVPAALVSAWQAASSQYPHAPKGVAINPIDTTDEQPVFFVKDRLVGGDRCATQAPGDGNGAAREFDTQTVVGLCQARRGIILCSSNAVRAMLSTEQQIEKEFAARGHGIYAAGVAASLVYLFAHEFGHILLGHPGSFFDGVTEIHLGLIRADNIGAFSRACEADNDQMKREAEADSFAFTAAKDVFSRQPFRIAGAGLLGAISSNSELIYWTDKSFSSWAAQYYGDFQGSPVPNVRQLCEMVGQTSGAIVSPVFGGSHPQLFSRLASEVSQASRYIATLQSGDHQGQDKDKDKGVARAWERNSLYDSIFAQELEKAAATFCKRASALENGQLDCKNLPKTDSSDVEVFVEGEKEATPGTYQAWFSYAQGNRERKNWQAARRGYEQALPLARQASDRVYVANILNDLGAIDFTENHLENAQKEFEECVEIRRSLVREDSGKHSPDLAGVLFNLGYLYARENRTLDARRSLSEALGIFRSLTTRAPAEYQPLVERALSALNALPN